MKDILFVIIPAHISKAPQAIQPFMPFASTNLKYILDRDYNDRALSFVRNPSVVLVSLNHPTEQIL